MLDKRDSEMIRIIMKRETLASEECMDAHLVKQGKYINAHSTEQKKQFNNRIEELSLNWDIRLDLRSATSENLILGELDRMYTDLQSQLDDTHSRLDELTEYYGIEKLDSVNQTLPLQMIQKVEGRVEALERKSIWSARGLQQARIQISI